MTASQTRHIRIAIIGAGPGGLCMGKRLLDEGFDDFVLLEKSDAVGGTWNLNRYPGCECDVQSALYSFSFEIKPDWSKPYGTQPEILAYMQHVAEKHGLLPHVRLGNGVQRAAWNESSSTWTLTLDDDSTVTADVVVSAIGMFNDLAWPAIDGLSGFGGTMFHSAQWDWDHDLAGERVAVIGSAASAVQFVPEIRKEAGMVHLFQRTANWVAPKLDTPYTEEQLEAFRRDPTPVLELRREVEDSMNKGMTFTNTDKVAAAVAATHAAIDQVEDPVVREKLRPQHPFGCKRPLMSNLYYPAFNEPNLELVTEPIARITANSVVTEDGCERVVDTIILATGFATTKYLSAIDVVGRDGRRIDDAWADGAQAYLGITTSGFPNLFMLYGPNTNNGSILTMIEYQVEHIVGHLRRIRDENLAWVDVRPEPMARYNEEVQRAIGEVPVWNAGCNGYYRSPSGRIVTQWPFSMTEFRERTAEIDPDDYEATTLEASPPATFEERLQALVGKPPSGGGRGEAPDPVNQAMIRHWAAAFEDANPLYTDPGFAATTRFGEVVAPPLMLQTWTMATPKITGIAERGGSPTESTGESFMTVFEEHGFTGTLAVGSEFEIERHLRLGERVSSSTLIESISEEKQTRLGRGHFLAWVTTYTVESGEVVGRQRFRILKFAPEGSR